MAPASSMLASTFSRAPQRAHVSISMPNVARFIRKHGDLVERLPKKELAAYLNLSPETLSRLKQRGKISV